MTAEVFIAKWSKVDLTERSASAHPCFFVVMPDNLFQDPPPFPLPSPTLGDDYLARELSILRKVPVKDGLYCRFDDQEIACARSRLAAASRCGMALQNNPLFPGA
jgi:hypothetical protein